MFSQSVEIEKLLLKKTLKRNSFENGRNYNRLTKTEASIFYFNHLSSQSKNTRCHKMPFCGCSTQWFSSGK